ALQPTEEFRRRPQMSKRTRIEPHALPAPKSLANMMRHLITIIEVNLPPIRFRVEILHDPVVASRLLVKHHNIALPYRLGLAREFDRRRRLRLRVGIDHEREIESSQEYDESHHRIHRQWTPFDRRRQQQN